MRIGIVIGRIGDIDGVSLETEKWIQVLKKMKHEIYIISGRFTDHFPGDNNTTLFPILSFYSPECEWEQKRAFYFPDEDPGELLQQLKYASEVIAIKLFKWIIRNEIEVLLVENAGALPCHLSMGMGIKRLVEHTRIRTICHDHDFYWEREDRYSTPHEEVREIVKTTFPLQIPHVRHVVINSYAHETLMNRYRIDSTIVPNVMDFSKPYAVQDDYNRDLLPSIGLKDDDIVLFQVTRIVKRKGIETAIELIERMNDKKVKLVITGSKADDERFGYFRELISIIKKKGLNSRICFGYQRILPKRGKTYRNRKIYSIPDAYANAKACTYFSTYEGFGNAFVECVLAKKPIFVNNYKPVYWPEIGSKGFRTVMLEDNSLTDEAVNEIEAIIHDEKLSREIAEYNFALGRKYFGIGVLQEKLEKLFYL